MKHIFKKIIATVLQAEARLILKKYNPKIVAVTGSVGKTSTKDAIYTILASKYYVRKSEKSFNSDIGVPLTILGCENAWSDPIGWINNMLDGLSLIFFKHEYPKWLVLEIGADSDNPKYIMDLTKWLKPDIAVFTGFAKFPVHVEFFGSREALFKEKAAVLQALKREGVAVINYDDDEVRAFAETIENKKVFFGFKGGTVKANNYQILTEVNGQGIAPTGVSFTVPVYDKPFVLSGALGRQQVYPALAALAVGHALSMSFADMHTAILSHVAPKGRMKLIPGLKGSLIIDDTYNASPIAVEEGLETLKALSAAHRTIAVIGDMLELGEYSSQAHKEVGFKAAGIVKMLVTVGVRARKIAEAALDGGLSEKNILQFDTSSEAGNYLQNIIEKGDVIWIKGSQSIRMEKTVKEIMAEPLLASELLVRQEKEWERR